MTRGAKIKTKKQKQKKAYIILGTLFVICVLFYLVQVNSIATTGYQMDELENKLSKLEEQKQKMELEIIQLQAVTNVDEKVASLNMVPVGDIKYLDGSSFVMAKK